MGEREAELDLIRSHFDRVYRVACEVEQMFEDDPDFDRQCQLERLLSEIFETGTPKASA